jgi:2-phosphosulfolactate phosphatase
METRSPESGQGSSLYTTSPNGANCARFGRDVPRLFVGALVNARAVAEAVAHHAAEGDPRVTVLACGERWRTPSDDGPLRFAVEDYLGAGAIPADLDSSLSLSPEAEVCVGAFRQAQNDIVRLLWESGSGRELRDAGFPQDVEYAARLDAYDAVPVMVGERLERWAGA